MSSEEDENYVTVTVKARGREHSRARDEIARIAEDLGVDADI